MQLELIAPANEDSTFLPRMAMGALAALVSTNDEVIYSDDLIRPFNIGADLKDVDLVGISIDRKMSGLNGSVIHSMLVLHESSTDQT